MSVLIIAEHDNKQLNPATLHAVTAAAKLGKVDLLVAGNGASATKTFATPATCFVSSTTAAALLPATNKSTLPNLAAAVTACKVAGFKCLLSCSAIINTLISVSSNHFGFVFQFFNQFGNACYFYACLTRFRLCEFHRFQTR